MRIGTQRALAPLIKGDSNPFRFKSMNTTVARYLERNLGNQVGSRLLLSFSDGSSKTAKALPGMKVVCTDTQALCD